MKILFNEIAPKMHIFCATRIGGYMFLQHCSSKGGGHKIFDHQIGGHKNIAEVLSEIYDPPFQRKWWPLSNDVDVILGLLCVCADTSHLCSISAELGFCGSFHRSYSKIYIDAANFKLYIL